MIGGKEVEPIGNYFPNDLESTAYILKYICRINITFKHEKHPKVSL